MDPLDFEALGIDPSSPDGAALATFLEALQDCQRLLDSPDSCEGDIRNCLQDLIDLSKQVKRWQAQEVDQQVRQELLDLPLHRLTQGCTALLYG